MLRMSAPLEARRTERATMQFRHIPTSIKINERVMGSRHSLEQAAQDDISELVASIRANGFDEKRPVLMVVESWMINEAAWRWDDMGDEDTAPAIAQGRHRWLAAMELGLRDVPCIVMTPPEYEEALWTVCDACGLEDALVAHLDEIIAADGDDVAIEF